MTPLRATLLCVAIPLLGGCAGLKNLSPLQRCYLADAEGTALLEQTAQSRTLIPAAQLSKALVAARTLSDSLDLLEPVCKSGTADNQTALIGTVEADVANLAALLPAKAK